VLHIEIRLKVRGRDGKHAEFHCSAREMERGMKGGVIHAGELREKRESGWDHPESETHLMSKSELPVLAGPVVH